ncbi:MAG: hypothetical protein ABJA78_05890 [Ferruginibacter sp.]
MYSAKKMLAVTIILFSTLLVTAQRTAPVQKFKPPKVNTVLGKYSDSAWISADEAAQLIATPLKITDSKNISYSLSSYQFAYKRVTVSEVEETGKAYTSSDLVASLFRTTPLPELWQNNIKVNLQKGEMLYFFDVAAKDPQGRLFFAPNLKIYIR